MVIIKICIPSYTCVDLSYTCVILSYTCVNLSYTCVILSYSCVNLSYMYLCHPILYLCQPILYLCHPILFFCQPILYLCHPILYLDHNGKEIYKQISCHQIWAPFCCTVAYLLKTNMAWELVHCLHNYIGTNGKMDTILSDNGAIFNNNHLNSFMKNLEIKKLASSPYISQARGSVEILVRYIRQSF